MTRPASSPQAPPPSTQWEPSEAWLAGANGPELVFVVLRDGLSGQIVVRAGDKLQVVAPTALRPPEALPALVAAWKKVGAHLQAAATADAEFVKIAAHSIRPEGAGE